MGKGGFDSYRRRRTGNRQQNNVILVVCGGETELIYFKKFNIDLRSPGQTSTGRKKPAKCCKTGDSGIPASTLQAGMVCVRQG